MNNPPFFYQSITELISGYKANLFSPVEVIKSYLERIQNLNDHLGAFINVSEEQSIALAKIAEKKFLRNEHIGKLEGIPIGLKDLIDTHDLPTTWGASFRRNTFARDDAYLVKQLRKHGAIIIGKHNLLEFAMGGIDYNPHYGATRNPWNREYFSGGSSSGTGAAVAAGMCTAGIGTDTGGSIRHPSSHCGITGLRPTHGLISAQGVLPLGKTADSVGPMTRTVTDIGIMLEAMLDSDLGSCDYTSVFNLTDLEGIRIGIDSNWIEEASHKEVLSLFRKGVEAFRNSGAVIIDIKIPEPKDLGFLYRDIVNYEAYRYHRTIFEMNGSSYGPEARRRMESGRSVTDVEYNSALIKKQKLVLAASDIFNRIDVMISPTQVKTAPKLEKRITESNLCSTASQTGFSSSMGAFLGFASFTGFPGLSIPMGFDSLGLPAGLQIIGPAFGENICLQVGHCYQMATNWHQHHPAIDFN